MIEVHHLNNSRSQRVLWLLEELEVPYELVKHQRVAATNLAPDSLKAVHPLGKSPVIRDGSRPPTGRRRRCAICSSCTTPRAPRCCR